MADEHETEARGEPGAEDPARPRLLWAAAQVFAEKGYARATTRAIAAAAGVNEVTLFRHFGTKKNLFMAVVEQFSPLSDLAAIAGGGLAPGSADRDPAGSYRDELLRLARLFQEVLGQRREAILMLLCEAQHLPELRDVVGQLPYRLRQAMGGYFRRQIAQGVVRPLDPEVLAQGFLGMVFAHQISLTVMASEMVIPVAPDVVTEQFVDVFVEGTLKR